MRKSALPILIVLCCYSALQSQPRQLAEKRVDKTSGQGLLETSTAIKENNRTVPSNAADAFTLAVPTNKTITYLSHITQEIM